MTETVSNDALPSPDNSAPTALLGFVNPLDVNRAYECSGWNVEKYVKRLVQIVEDPKTPARVAVATAEMLRLLALSTLQIGEQMPRLPGNVAVEVLPAVEQRRLEDSAARTQSMLGGVEEDNEDSQAEDTDNGKEDQPPNDQIPGVQDGPEGSGGTEAGAGQVSTDEVYGHRPPAGTRRGLCGPQPSGG